MTTVSGMPTVFLFAGQGSQYYQMGKELFENNARVRYWLQHVDEVFADYLGTSIVAEMYRDDRAFGAAFEAIAFTHPAIFGVQYALARAVMEDDIQPDYVLGTSLGELVAATIASVMPLEACVRVIADQIGLFSRQGKAGEGGMLAVVAPLDICREHEQVFAGVEFAAINHAQHFVVAGADADLLRIERFLQREEILFQRLPVPVAFHSRYIEPFRTSIQATYSSVVFQLPHLPFVSAMSASCMPSLDAEHFWQVARQPIRFSESIVMLERADSYFYLDFGPRGTLANFSARNFSRRSSSRALHLLCPFGAELQQFARLAAVRRSHAPALPRDEIGRHIE